MMHGRNVRTWHRFARSERGVSTLEFAFIAPFMFILIFGSFELALDMIADASVQIAAEVASRSAMVMGAPPAGVTPAQQVSATVHQILDMWAPLGGNVNVQLTAYSALNELGGANGVAGVGAGGSIVTYNVSLTMPAFTGVPSWVNAGSPFVFTFSRNFVVQNEQ